MAESARPKVLGDTIGRYQLLVPIGQGGMAEVFLGRLRGVAGFAKLVVIKRLHSHLSHDKRFIELFINEGRVVAQLSHPNICQVHELGEAEGNLFLAMEYLAGVPLEEVLRVLPRGTAHELPLLAGILGQACEGLHYAHQLRDRLGNPTPVVHRDVSPQNLFVTTDGICKVLDFGVAKISTSDRFSQSGMIKGKLPYMAPEQIRGQRVDARTDVFAMGAVLWEALTGTRLFARNSDYQIWKAITEDPIPRLSQVRPDLPREIEEVVRCALERSPAHRYQTIAALGADLRRAAKPAAYDASIIAEALRSLCAERLAATSTLVDSALHQVERPTAERTAVDDEPSAAETLQSSVTPSVRLRDESVVRSRPIRRRRKRWPLALALAALATAGAAAAFVLVRGDAPREVHAEVERKDALGLEEPLQILDEGLRVVGTGTRKLEDTARTLDGVRRAGEALVDDLDRDDADDDDDDADADVAPTATAPADPSTPRVDRRSKGRRSDGKAAQPRAAAGEPEVPAPPDPARAPPPAEPAAPGFYSVDSRPYASIFIDGKAYGETPLFRVSLPPGTHQVRAVRADGTVKQFSISVSPGKEVSSGQLKW